MAFARRAGRKRREGELCLAASQALVTRIGARSRVVAPVVLVAIVERFSQPARDVLVHAHREVHEHKHERIGSEHNLLGLITHRHRPRVLDATARESSLKSAPARRESAARRALRVRSGSARIADDERSASSAGNVGTARTGALASGSRCT